MKSCSAYFPTAIFISVPPPFTWRWKLHSRDHRLCPTVTGLVSSPLCVLEKCCLCRRKTVNSSTFLCEQPLPGFIDKFLAASTVVQQDYKSFQWTQPIFYGLRGSIQGTESWCDFVMRTPYVPCSPFAPASKNMTPCHNQRRHEALAKQHNDQDPVRWPSRGPVNSESSFQHQRQSIVR